MYNKKKRDTLKRDVKYFTTLTSFYQNLKELTTYKAGDTIWSDTTNLSESLNKKLDNLLVEIYGSSDAGEALWRQCCR
jgi:hypothetical protein